MQTTHKIAVDSADAYSEYLTSTSARGDYYTDGPGAEEAGLSGATAQSRWHGSSVMVASLRVLPQGPVERDDLVAVMRGVSPVDGHELRPTGGNGSRVAGIDLTFSAPKSVSALWAVSSPYERAQIEAAHSHAVAGTIERIERDVELVRIRSDGVLHWEPADRLLAAEFVHTSSRLTRDQERGGVPDPQLHSHVVVLGAERADGQFAAVDSRELFRSARANGAWYRAELASGLQRLGVDVQGRTGRGERYFEVAGVPEKLVEHWSARAADIDRAARAFRTRYGRDPKGGELSSIAVGTRGTKTSAVTVDVDQAWRAVGEEYGLSRGRAQSLFAGSDHTRELGAPSEADLARELPGELTRERSVVTDRDMRARAYELAAGVCTPAQADGVVEHLVRSGELVALEGGLWTTTGLREREQRTLAVADSRTITRTAPVSEESLRSARTEVQREIGAALSPEQCEALQTITGRGGVSALVGQAGTGKGAVIAAAARAWEREGYEVIGTAVAGATAERLGADAKLEYSATTDALTARASNGQTRLGPTTVVVMDEAGMADTARLSRLVELTARTESKLLLVGDQAQLSSIGAGGMFAALQERVPTAQLSEVHRARNGWEREAWANVRDGQSQRALASYQAHDRLHISDTREKAAQQMVSDWNAASLERPDRRTVMLTDASNAELDRINALAQHARARAGELGAREMALSSRPYGLAAGDEVIFAAALRQPGEERVENGTLGSVVEADPENGVTIQTHGARPRELSMTADESQNLRLSYAQHVYKAQGRTVDRAFVLAGGWQTDRETAYVAVTRAQERTDLYVSREDLGEQGMDTGAIERLGDAMAESHAEQASITIPERESDVGRIMQEQDRTEHDRDRELGHTIE